MYKLNNKNKIITIILLVAFLVVDLFGVLSLAPKDVANAILPGPGAGAVDVAGVAADATAEAVGFVTPLKVDIIGDKPGQKLKIEMSVEQAILAASMSALMNGVSYFTRKLAYDAATYAAYGGQGKGALVFTDSPGDYFKGVALDSAAEAISELGQPFGLNLCQTPNLQAQLFIQIGLRSMYADQFDVKGGPTPKCNWQTLSNSWSAEAFERKYGPGGRQLIARTFHDSLRVKDTDFGIALGAMAQVDRIKAKTLKSAEIERLEGDGFKAVKKIISGQVKTPASVVYEEAKAATANNQSKISTGQIAGIYGSGLLQVIPQAGSVFINTLVSSLLNRIMTEGLIPDKKESRSEGVGVEDFFSQFVVNREKAEKAFSFLFTDFPNEQLNNYPLLAEFAACEEEAAGLSLNNCVMDTGMQRALEVGRADGNPLTIAEAIEQNMLHGDWWLISPKREADNQDFTRCYQKAYCYYNIQKLRKARILPLGFEIAALRADPDNPQNWSLKNVVAGFEDCAYKKDEDGIHVLDAEDNKIVVPSSAKPFCHLINPNWILKIPEIRCESLVVGPQLITSASDQRRKECVDYSTKIFTQEESETSVNKPEDYYSYCLKEKNIWKIGVETCDKQYNTCQTYVDTKGQSVSYLNRTLDYGRCNLESVGCQPYALEADKDDWLTNLVFDVDKKLASWNQNIYFNNKIANYTCSEDADGCNLFYNVEDGGGQGDSIYLQKAPDYLGCYDKDIDDGEYDIDWPQTKVDLIAIKDRPEECADFSQVCTPIEVGCELYSSIADPTSPEIPGIIGDNLCQAECVGYDTYKQLATEFELEEFPLYFTPGNDYSDQGANECNGAYAGCDQFTNIDEMSAGGEGLEYYIDLKYCEEPDGQNEKAYYSWEGSELEGYVLKIHRMEPIDKDDLVYLDNVIISDADDNIFAADDLFIINSPAYAGDSQTELQENYTSCNEDIYNLHLNTPYNLEAWGFDPSCRALYDRDGNIYYRILGKTVTVSDDCHPLRKTNSYLAVDDNLGSEDRCVRKGGFWDGDGNGSGECQRCSNGGFYDEGYETCIYYSIPSESISCPAIANGCRLYTGNQGGNIEEVYFAGFEPTSDDDAALGMARTGWTPSTKVRPESIYVGGYSLQAQSDITYKFQPDEKIDSYAWYELSFWARGEAQNINEIYFSQDGTKNGSFTYDINLQQNLKVSLGNEWQEYKFGPVQFTGVSNSEVSLVFDVVPYAFEGSYYLDNVRFTRLQDQYALIKDSWQTSEGYDISTTCDVNPYDGFPGLALGCQAYKDDRDRIAFATGFDSLCRPEAVGCTALYDTYNTLDSENVLAYNLWCVSDAVDYVGECKIRIEVDGEIEELGTCQIENGQAGCFVEEVMLSYGVEADAIIDWVVDSTIIIPADTAIDSPIYLTDTENYICYDKDMGCTRVAAREYKKWSASPTSTDFEFVETFIKNDPGNYSDTLCTSDQVTCGEFKSDNGSAYFKDPKLNGNGICNYLPLIEIGGNNYSGWYRDIDRDFDGEIDEVPEHCSMPTNFEVSLPSNGSGLYKGLVGICPQTANNCREIVDKADTGGISPDGKSYYVIYDDQVERRSGECEGQVNPVDGCVLFDKTDEPNKLYDTKATYKKTEESKEVSGQIQRYQSVRPISKDVKGFKRADANVILKVDRDRTCSEWLDCELSRTVADENGVKREICYSFGTCLALGADGECVKWDKTERNLDSAYLDYDNYIGRISSWYGIEYSGYTLYNKFPVSDLKQVDVGENSYMGYVDSRFNNNCQAEAVVEGYPCGESVDKQGRCFSGVCLFPMDKVLNSQNKSNGTIITPDELSSVVMGDYYELISCKAYPEENSPFPKNAVLSEEAPDYEGDSSLEDRRYDLSNKKNDFADVNVCQTGNCSCNYVKVTFENTETDYWPADYGAIPEGICYGGVLSVGLDSTDGAPCSLTVDDPEDHCGEGGICIPVEKKSIYMGEPGFCLEYDRSRPLSINIDDKSVNYPCLTWLPLEIKTDFDIYESVQEAGFYPKYDAPSGADIYCLESSQTQYNFAGDLFADYTNSGWDWESMLNEKYNNCVDHLQDTKQRFDQLEAGNNYEIDPSESESYQLIFAEENYFRPFRKKDEDKDYDTNAPEGTYYNFIKALDGNQNEYDEKSFSIVFDVNRGIARQAEEYKNCSDECVEKASNLGFFILPAYNLCLIDDGCLQDVFGFDLEDWNFCTELGEWSFKADYTWHEEPASDPDKIKLEVVKYDSAITDKPTLVEFSRAYLKKQNKPYFKEMSVWDDKLAIEDLKENHDVNGETYTNDYCYSYVPSAVNPLSTPPCDDMDSSVSSTYQSAVCCDNDANRLSEIMQNWAWQYISPNTMLLRVERGIEGNGSEFGFINGPESKERSIYGFYPSVWGSVLGFGTIMHPPRVWQKSADPVSYKYVYDQYGITNTSLKHRYDEGFRISTIAMSPGPWMNDENEDGGVASKVKRSKYEGVLNLADLQRVHFVPLAFPRGAEGVNPAMLSTDFYIDYNVLADNKSDTREASRASKERSGDDLFGGSADRTERDIVWNYKLNRDDLKDMNYKNYSEALNDGSQDLTDERFDSRNEIHSRYVAVFVDSLDVLNDAFGADGGKTQYVPIKNGSDPFSVVCHHDYKDDLEGKKDTNNWMAIGMDFNREGEFLGYISRVCHAHENDAEEGNGIVFATFATLNSQCTNFVQVYKDISMDNLAAGTNKAWTNLVWEFSTQNKHPDSSYSFIKKDQTNTPFGMSILSDSLSGGDVMEDPLALRQLTFGSFANSGMPYSCRGNWLFVENLDFLIENYCEPVQGIIGIGSDIRKLSAKTLGDAEDSIFKLFAKVYGQKILATSTESNFPFDAELKPIYKDGPLVYKDGPLADPVLVDKSYDFGVGRAPRIYSLNTYTCQIPEGSGCTAAEQDAFTVNMKNGQRVNANYDGVIEDESTGYDGDEDYDGDFWPDPLIGNETFLANIKFFVSANDNHMPIKRIMVDWGDGSPLFKTEGMFKNSKPFCASVNDYTYASQGFGRCWGTQITCTEDSDCSFLPPLSIGGRLASSPPCSMQPDNESLNMRWLIRERNFGDAPRACTTNYFEFSKSLTCGSDDKKVSLEATYLYGEDSDPDRRPLTEEIKQQILDIDPYATEFCVFKPKVQVLDNWGWCNRRNGGGLWNDEWSEEEGEYKRLCDEMLITHAYTEYQGNIIIVPGNE